MIGRKGPGLHIILSVLALVFNFTEYLGPRASAKVESYASSTVSKLNMPLSKYLSYMLYRNLCFKIAICLKLKSVYPFLVNDCQIWHFISKLS